MSSLLEVPARSSRVVRVNPFGRHSPDPPPDPEHRPSYKRRVRVGDPVRGALSQSHALQQGESGHPWDYRGTAPRPAPKVSTRPIFLSAPAGRSDPLDAGGRGTTARALCCDPAVSAEGVYRSRGLVIAG
jgi:hypothetical protein